MKRMFVLIALSCLLLCGCYSCLEAQWSHDPTESQMILNGSINHVMISDGLGGAIIAASVWVVNDYLVVQRVGQDGHILWDETLHGIPVAQKDPQDATTNPCLLSDGRGGVFIAYSYRQAPSYKGDVYIQYIDSSGVVLWGEKGVPIYTGSGSQGPVGIVTDGEGGMIVVWVSKIEVEEYIYEDYSFAQRVSGEGEMLWAQDGVFMSNAILGLSVSDGVGGAIMMPTSGPGGQRISGDGELLWDEMEINARVGNFREMASDGFGNVIVSGRKSDEQGLGLFVQKMDSDGNLLWEEGGIRITPTVDSQTFRAKITVDSLGNSIFTWRDRRTGDFNIYAQKLNSSGEIQWDESGILISPCESIKSFAEITNDGLDNSIVVWWDRRNNKRASDLYSQKLDGAGQRKWPQNDVAINVVDNAPSDLSIVCNGSGGAVIAWYFAAEWRGVYVAMVDIFGILGGGSKGDVNGDGDIDVLDVIRLVNIILILSPQPTEYELWSGDLNEDRCIDVLDVILLVNILRGTSNWTQYHNW